MAAFLMRALGLTPIIPPDPPPSTSPTTTTSTPGPPNPGDVVNCDDLPTWAAAQAYYDLYFPFYGDVANLDSDDDGIVCETLPGAP
jgi:Excalibur calcium-binding domain